MNASNWAGNHVYEATEVLRPGSVDQLRELVAEAPRVKALGTRHCFNDIADFAGGVQIDLSGVDSPIEIDSEAATVTVGAATRYGDLAKPLHAAGFALANLASLPHCTVAGSVATATHGSGQQHQSLASAVSALELVTAEGRLRALSRDRDPDVFPGLVVSLGAVGVITRITLDLVPAFDVRQDVFDRLPWAEVFEHFDAIQDSAYSVSMFTNWANDTVDQIWLKTRVAPDAPFESRTTFHGAVAADGPRHPAHAAGVSAENCTEQFGVAGPWHDRLPHFTLEFVPSTGDELQSEYFVPRRHAVAAFEALRGLGELLAPLILVSEIRTVAADDLWLSPFYRTDSVALHFTWRPRQAAVEAVLPVIEQALAPYGVRPHWGKLFHGGSMGYPRLPEFRDLVMDFDPGGTFRSPFVRRHVFGDA